MNDNFLFFVVGFSAWIKEGMSGGWEGVCGLNCIKFSFSLSEVYRQVKKEW